MAVQVKLGRRVVLVGVGVVLAVLVAAVVVVQGGSDRDEGGAMAVAPSRSAPSVGDFAAEKSTGAGDAGSDPVGARRRCRESRWVVCSASWCAPRSSRSR
ncbi:hypothetical protein BJF90_34570 [Pseudonocardia sp. CNS-004]|nr:hypothetical protein BJF90_34570 [Pseudonocardia sp. CNS-004]